MLPLRSVARPLTELMMTDVAGSPSCDNVPPPATVVIDCPCAAKAVKAPQSAVSAARRYRFTGRILSFVSAIEETPSRFPQSLFPGSMSNVLPAILFVLATARPFHLTLEANPAAPFPFLSKFGNVTLQVYPNGVRAESMWLRGFSRNGAPAVTVEDPLNRTYSDV